MALSTILTYAVALSVPAWLVAEQLYSWRAERTQRSTALRADAASTPAHPRPFSPDLNRTTA